MERTRVYYVCDRCKKEVEKDKVIRVTSMPYCYELCEECKESYDEYQEKIKELEEQIDEITKIYQFGKHLPKESE